MLELAKVSRDFSKAYSKIADGLYKQERFSEALKYYNKVDSVTTFLQDWEDKFMANLFITGIYQKVGLVTQTNEGLKEINGLSKKINKDFPAYMIKQQKATFLEESGFYKEAIPVRLDILMSDEKRLNKDILTFNDQFLLINSYSRLGYNYLKCNMPEKADYYIKKADEIFKNMEKENNLVAPIYYMVKGFSAIRVDNDRKASLFWFDKSLDEAQKNNSQIQITQILEERLENNIDDSDVHVQLFRKLKQLKQKKKEEAARIILICEQKKNSIVAIRNSRLLLLSVFVLVLFLYYNLYYKRIGRPGDELEKMTQNNELSAISILPLNNLQKDNDKQTGRIMSDEKERALLNKICEFENGKDFLESSFTIANMATLLETNSRYINYILQNYRQKSFSHYINSLRIKYCIKLLQENPEYLNYKISHLSDVCGYSSHSRFTHIFKKEVGISPSDFIARLSKEKKPDI